MNNNTITTRKKYKCRGHYVQNISCVGKLFRYVLRNRTTLVKYIVPIDSYETSFSHEKDSFEPDRIHVWCCKEGADQYNNDTGSVSRYILAEKKIRLPKALKKGSKYVL